MEPNDKLEILYGLCKIVMEKLGECEQNLSRTKDMSVSDIEIVDKLSHSLKSIKACIAMMEEEEDEGGMSERSYRSGARGRSNRRSREGGSYEGGSYEGGSYEGSYEGGASGRRGRSPRTGRYVSRDGGYSGHGGIEDILDDVQDMTESEKRKLKMALERM